MFQFTWLPLLAPLFQTRVTGHYPSRVSPFGYPRIVTSLTAPRGFSQPATSFFGSQHQGIHRGPLVAWNIENPRQFMLAMQFSRFRETSMARFTMTLRRLAKRHRRRKAGFGVSRLP